MWLKSGTEPYTLEIEGTGTGTFTLIVEEYSDEVKLREVLFPETEVQSGSLVTVRVGAFEDLVMESDFDGDGAVDEVILPNQRPVAHAGGDHLFEATSPEGAEVTLDGHGSVDPDGNALEYFWSGTFGIVGGQTARVVFGIGDHTHLLTL